MRKNIIILILIQLILSFISALLISKMSFIGRLGINLFYREYLIFKTVWKTALAIFAIQFVLVLVLSFFKYLTPNHFSRIIAIVALVIGIAGSYFTFIDFTTTSHRHMKMYFHSGGYLFWISWSITCMFFIFSKKKKVSLTDLSIIEEKNIQKPSDNKV
ncbi:cytochrome d ubiquinol oxidase subunit II [Myroides indicus]|uniref:Uncharacterized protein n=1 Tax=Myroides indicus TaxID=1323422 RepID=A0A4R7EYX9_9FLAO|nr:cytochrome d ubiquinol oxidase subunit II [Myroides indicus]TDS54651.1 hypothetical protein C8P70_12447 [Myroides indicus]